jgi:hypothetical protein
MIDCPPVLNKLQQTSTQAEMVPDPHKLLRALSDLLRGVSVLHEQPSRHALKCAADDLQLRAALLRAALDTDH